MSKPEEKKWNVEFCRCLPNHGRCKYCLTFPETPKPSPSQSCEHDKGTIWRTETGNGGFGVCSKVVPCPFCKPTAVEPKTSQEMYDYLKDIAQKIGVVDIDSLLRKPAVEEIATKTACVIMGEVCRLMTYNEKEECVEFQCPEAVLKFVRDTIAEALRNERNRK